MRTLELSLAAALAALAAPAQAAVVQQHSSFGGYTVSYDPAQQSPAITQLLPFFGGMYVDLNAAFQGEPENDGLDNGITETVFTVSLNLTFTPDPGVAFTSLSISDDTVSWHHGFFGGEEFGETTTITPLHAGASQVISGPNLVNIPPWGQGGGGAYNAGIVFGSVAPPPGGFNVDMTQTIVLFDNSSWAFGRVNFELGTEAAAAPGIPEPTTWALMLLGFGAAGGLLRICI